MPIAVTLDQQASRHAADLVAVTARDLNDDLRDGLRLPFVRTAGDEMQALIGTGHALVAIARRCLEDGGWWIGVGIGPVEEPLGATARDSRGPAFWAAREAVNLAQKRSGGPPGPVAVVGEPPRLAESIEAALSAVAYIVSRRTDRQREAVAAARRDASVRTVAGELDVTASAASQLLRLAGFEEQRRLERLVANLADDAV
jgi:hypothetical protein